MVKELLGKNLVHAVALLVVFVPALGAQPAKPKRPKQVLQVAFIGGSVTSGMAWRRYEHLSTASDPIEFCEKQFKRDIQQREYDLRTDSISACRGVLAVDPARKQVCRNYSLELYKKPDRWIANMLKNATNRNCRLIVGMDMLIWFVHGPVKLRKESARDRAQSVAEVRMKGLGRALAIIDKYVAKARANGVKCTFVVGDVPDLSGGNAVLLPKDRRPTRAVLKNLNRRLRSFAAEREDVILFPMRRILAEAVAETLDVSVAGKPCRIRSSDALQFDEIHPNRLGMAVLLTELYACVKRGAPHQLDCLPDLTDFGKVAEKLGTSLEDLAYLRTRDRKKPPTKAASGKSRR